MALHTQLEVREKKAPEPQPGSTAEVVVRIRYDTADLT